MVTRLQFINNVLMDLGLQTVNNSGLSSESRRVANISRGVYDFMVSRVLWPHRKRLVTLESLSNSDVPTGLKIPDNIIRLDQLWYKYDDSGKTVSSELCYREPEDFLSMVFSSSCPVAGTVMCTLPNGISFPVGTDSPPSMWTTFDDSIVILDSYRGVPGQTVMGQDTVAVVFDNPGWPEGDEDVVPVPTKFMAMFEAQVKAVASAKIKKEESPYDDQQFRTAFNRAIHQAKIAGDEHIGEGSTRVRYGRR